MEKNNHNTNYEKSINRRNSRKGEPTEEITKRSIDEIIEYGPDIIATQIRALTQIAVATQIRIATQTRNSDSDLDWLR